MKWSFQLCPKKCSIQAKWWCKDRLLSSKVARGHPPNFYLDTLIELTQLGCEGGAGRKDERDTWGLNILLPLSVWPKKNCLIAWQLLSVSRLSQKPLHTQPSKYSNNININFMDVFLCGMILSDIETMYIWYQMCVCVMQLYCLDVDYLTSHKSTDVFSLHEDQLNKLVKITSNWSLKNSPVTNIFNL